MYRVSGTLHSTWAAACLGFGIGSRLNWWGVQTMHHTSGEVHGTAGRPHFSLVHTSLTVKLQIQVCLVTLIQFNLRTFCQGKADSPCNTLQNLGKWRHDYIKQEYIKIHTHTLSSTLTYLVQQFINNNIHCNGKSIRNYIFTGWQHLNSLSAYVIGFQFLHCLLHFFNQLLIAIVTFL